MSAPGKANRRNQGDDTITVILDLCDLFIHTYINVFFPCVTGKIDHGGWKNHDISIIMHCSLTEHIQCCGHRANVTKLIPNRTPFSISLTHNPRSYNKVVKTCCRRFPYILKHDRNIWIFDRQWYIS